MGQPSGELLSLSGLLDSTHDGVFVLDAQRRFILFNQACERITGWPAQEVMGTACQCGTITNCHDQQGRSLSGVLCPGLAVFQGSAPMLRQRMSIQTRGGDTRWVETQYTPIRDEFGRPMCVIGVMRDDSDAREREQGWHETINDLREEIESLRTQLRQRYGFEALLTRSASMQTVLERINAACGTGGTVLIIGEAGTGKQLIARTIHEHGGRRERPFASMSASAIPADQLDAALFGTQPLPEGAPFARAQGLLATAEGGTLYMEDIEALPNALQLKLLRALQDRRLTPAGSSESRPFDVRLIAATRKPLHELLAAERLRQDLYYRLGAVTIDVPPLRFRREDIPLLVRHLLDQLNATSERPVFEVSSEAWQALDAHSWPGNVRELFGVVEAAFSGASEGRILAENLRFPPRLASPPPSAADQPVQLDARLADIERQTILDAIRRARGQRNLAARLMGISRSRLYRRMDVLGIKPDDEL